MTMDEFDEWAAEQRQYWRTLREGGVISAEEQTELLMRWIGRR